MSKGHQKDLQFLDRCKRATLKELLQLLKLSTLVEWKRVAVQRAIKRLLVMEGENGAHTDE